MAAQLTLTNGPGRERALAMHVRRQQLLAGARLAGEQHADVRPRDLRRLLDRLPERGAPADHLRRLADQLAEPLVLALQVRSLERVLGDEQHAIARERLLEEIERAAARRVHRVANRAVAGNHHHRRRFVALPQRAQQLDAVAVGQTQIEQIEIGARRAALGVKLRRRLAHGDAVAFALQNQAQRLADVRLVVDDDDVARAASRGGSWRGPSASAGSVTLNAAPPQLAAHQDDVAAGEQRVALRDRQAESHAVLLERDRRLEQRRGRFRR